MELYGAGILFQKFLNKLMQRERDFGGRKYFSKISYLPSPLKVNWIPLSTPFLLCCQQTDLTRRQHTPARTERHNALRMKMRLNKDVRWTPKSAPVATPWPRQSLSRPTSSVTARWIRKCR